MLPSLLSIRMCQDKEATAATSEGESIAATAATSEQQPQLAERPKELQLLQFDT